MPTSKKYLFLSLLLTVSLCIAQFFTEKDITTIICASFAEVSVYSAFYLWKAKVENKNKYAMKWVNKMAEKYGIEAITPIIQSIIQD